MLDFSFSCVASGSPTATIDSFTPLHTGLLVAPAQIKLRAVPGAGFNIPSAPAGTDYDPQRHVITYISTVRGSPLAAPSHAPTNLLTAWKDPNVAYGQEPTFVFDQPGTYDIDLWAVDEDGNWGEATYQVVVQDADTYYAGALTICYSETDFTGAPAGATQVGSLSALNSALTAQAGNDVRVMFRGGEHFDFGTYISSGGVANWSITTFGDGGHASLQLARYFSDTSNDVVAKPPTSGGEQKYYEIDLLGDWDASKETGADGQSPFWHQDVRDTLVHKCTISGHNTVFTPAKPADATTIIFTFSDTYITNWSNFGIFSYSYDQGGSRYYSVLDCAIHQNVDAAGGFLGDRSLSNAHGPWRLEDADNVYCARTSFYSRNGWSAGIPTAAQPCIRWNSDPGAGTVGYFDRCVMQGGYRIINVSPQDGGGGTAESQDKPTNVIFDKIITIGTADTEGHIWVQSGGTTVRNWFGYEPNIPKRGYGLEHGMFSLETDDPSPDADNLDTPVRLHSSTMISLLSSANNRYTSTEADNENVEDISEDTTFGTFTDFTTENNIWHAPNQNAAVNASPAPDLATASGVTCTHKGRKDSLGIYDDTLGSTIADSGVLSIPYSAFDDKDGTPTNQAYWQSLASPGSLRHTIIVAGVQGKMFSYLGDFSVSFANATNMEITNTSGQSWTSGSRIRMKPDHSEFQMAMDATFSSDGLAVPLARPLSADAWSSGRIAQDDLTATARDGSDIEGAPAGTPTRGAFEYD